MTDIFRNYNLQREELLARIAQELQLNKTRFNKMESAYTAVSDLLKSDPDFFNDLEIEIYPQGSTRTKTTVKPLNGEDFDLDTVLHIYSPYHNYTPSQIYEALVKALEKDAYYKSIMEKKKRCVRLNYKDDFHLDILPGCMPDGFEKQRIMIPEKMLNGWSSANPKGFAEWFLKIANSVTRPLLFDIKNILVEAKIETERLPDDLYSKSPLQRSVQLLKRYRDIYFENREFRVSSIVITTLAALYYSSENSIFDAIDNIVAKIKRDYDQSVQQNQRFKILNPVNPQEDFTDSWTTGHYNAFKSFLGDFHYKWQNLKNSFETSSEDYIKLFGEGVYKQSLTEQVVLFSNVIEAGNDRSAGLILREKAYTDQFGRINEGEGIKNGCHHNFGE
jgi:hypothetical protein